MTSYIAFCLYLMNKMRRNLIKIRSCTTLSNLKLLNMVDLGYLPFICENRKFSLSLSLFVLCQILRLSGHFSIFGLVFYVLKSLMGIVREQRREKFAILILKSRSHVRILIYRTWAIVYFFLACSRLPDSVAERS